MTRHLPLAAGRRLSAQIATRIGSDFETSRIALGMTIEDTSRRAQVAPSTVVRVLNGDGGAHLDTVCAVGLAVGMRVGMKAYPSAQPTLRDSGQLRMAQCLVGLAHSSLRPAMEVPVGDPFGRAADLLFFAAHGIFHHELEKHLPDFQASYRAATVKRDALQANHTRPVWLVITVEDTRRNRALVAPHAELIRTALPATSREIMHSLRTGQPLGRDGLLWLRPWRRA
jgi:hypothetical protein